jgi:ABC-type transport system involved in cytochrome c biogenesis ATPase subunit
MKKNLKRRHFSRLQKGVRKIRLKTHCKLSRKDHWILDEVNVILDQSKITKTRKRKLLKPLTGILKFIAKFLRKMTNVIMFCL